MLMILSPAKTIDDKIINKPKLGSENLPFSNETNVLIDILKEFSVDELSKLMKISDKLAILNYDRFRKFYDEDTKDFTAILAFKGEAYRGLAAKDFSEDDFLYSQNVLRILSGLYGVIKPIDRIKEYRLEMGTKLKNNIGKDLYEFWDDKITNNIEKAIEDSYGDKVLINLASKEYSTSIDMDRIKRKYDVINISFLENREGQYKLIGTYAKKARGMMVRYIIKNKIDTVEGIKEFDEECYQYNEYLSSEDNLVFTR